jgi:hypothetical protein
VSSSGRPRARAVTAIERTRAARSAPVLGGLAALLLLRAALAGAAPPAAEPAPPAVEPPGGEPLCLVEASLDRSRAFVGEQLHYHVRVLRRPDATHGWETPLAFPRARAEWLVGLAAGSRGPREGPHRVGLSEHRAVFAAHPGTLRIEGASVRCVAADGEEVVAVPAVLAEIEALPSDGRPAGFTGLVGPVRWSAVLTPERVALGGSARLSVVAIGSGNTWLAPSPAPQLRAVAALEVFVRPAELARDAGRELVWRRYFAFELVPRQAGRLALPELRLPHFDPAARAYAETRLALPALVVREGPAGDGPATAPAPPAAERAGRAERRLPAAVAAAGLLASALAALALGRRRRRRARAAAPRDAAGWLGEARAAQARGDAGAAAAAAERALRGALASAPAGAWAHAAAALLARVERGRFAPGAERPALAEVEALLAARPTGAGC